MFLEDKIYNKTKEALALPFKSEGQTKKIHEIVDCCVSSVLRGKEAITQQEFQVSLKRVNTCWNRAVEKLEKEDITVLKKDSIRDGLNNNPAFKKYII